jgi:V/A-type H+-transporting ATPase subunit B
MPLEKALDRGWETLAECFDAHELLMKQELIDKYFPRDIETTEATETTGE